MNFTTKARGNSKKKKSSIYQLFLPFLSKLDIPYVVSIEYGAYGTERSALRPWL